MKVKGLFTLIVVSLLFSSCSNGGNGYDASGVFEATEVIVSAKGSGEIVELDIVEGQEVEAGRPIGVIDTLQLHLKRRQLLATIEAVEARQVNISKQTAAVEQQIALQKVERARFEKLVEADVANQKQLDDINGHIVLLEKQLAAQRELQESGNRSIAAEKLSLEVQIAQVDEQIRQSVITSPIDGVILSKYAQQGELAMQGRTLFKVADIVNMTLRVYITADQLTMLKIGGQVRLFADEGREERREYVGKVVWIADKAEFTPKTIQTRDERANLVYAVKVAVVNDGYIKRGMYGEIMID